MSKTLTDPDKPAHAIIGEREDGSPLRNDGMPLTPANQNPWYVLATVHGEPAAVSKLWNRDEELAKKNRDAWNLWMCHELSDDDLADRAEKVELKPEDLVPHKSDGTRDTEAAKKQLAAIGKKIITRLTDAKVENPKTPDTAQGIVFSRLHFERLLNFKKFVFEKTCRFDESVFAGDADFDSTTFTGLAYFGSATFTGSAYFRSATFTGDAYFVSATFTGTADFHSATFTGYADFGFTTFTGSAYFRSATFCQQAVFSSAKFKSTTSFEKARFLTHVPAFHAAQLYDDTDFTLPQDYLENWPPLSGEVEIKGKKEPVEVMPADKQKKAYNRLRLFMNKSMQIDEEQFFHRMEMRCKHELASKAHKPIYWLFDRLSEYGSSVTRPLFGLLGSIVIGALVMLGYLAWETPANGAVVWEAAGWSIANSLPFLGFGKVYYSGYAAKLPVLLKILGGVQTIFGYILLFFLGLGLRNRFRLR